MSNNIEIAVLPVGGMGTRFLPITKSAPKEMLPIVDKPIIQYAVEEAVAAGIKQIIFITSSSKHAIEDYFDSNYELESRLQLRQDYQALKTVTSIVPPDVSIAYVRQSAPLGLGHAILCARKLIADKPFAILLPDDVILDNSGHGPLVKMVERFATTQASVIALRRVPQNEVSHYGVVSMGAVDNLFSQLHSIVEKPLVADAPSDVVVTGRYILTPAIFDFLENTTPGAGGEIQLTDAIARLLKNQPIEGYLFSGEHYDCGSKLGWLKATIAFALQRSELTKPLTAYLETLLDVTTSTPKF